MPGMRAAGSDDNVAVVRRQAQAVEQRCAELAADVSRLAALVTETIERPVSQPLAVSPEEAARLLGIGRTNLFRLLETGAVRSVKVGSRRLIPRRALDELLADAERQGMREAG